jgi:hypothetical protein
MKRLTTATPYLFLLMVLPLAIPSMAQTGQQRTTRIVLQDGTVMKGIVDDWTNGDTIRFLPVKSASVVEILFDDIQSMKFRPEKIEDLNIKANPNGVYFSASAGLLLGMNWGNYTIACESGYRFGDHWAFGLGINYERYHIYTSLPDRWMGITANSIFTVLPVIVNARAYLSGNIDSPYFFAGGGYGFGWTNTKMEDFDWLISDYSVRGGPLGRTGIGYQARGKNLSLALELGIKIQESEMVYQYVNDVLWENRHFLTSVKEKRSFRRMFFSVAAVF